VQVGTRWEQHAQRDAMLLLLAGAVEVHLDDVTSAGAWF
jgi:hypothetical protein